MLSILLAIPLVGALLLFLWPMGERAARRVALATAAVAFLGSLLLFGTPPGGPVWTETVPWIRAFGVSYAVGVDGLSFFLVLLTTLITLVVIPFVCPPERVRTFLGLVLLTETTALGAFVSRDLLLFYVFWEAMLIPAYLLLAGFGGKEGPRAAVKFLLFSLIPSLFMLVAILVLAYIGFQQHGVWSFGIGALTGLNIPTELQVWLFLAFFVAFAVKVPLFPLHSWLPDAYGEAPPPVAVLLSSILSKTGLYAFLRIAFPLLPAGAHALTPLMVVLALIGLLYGALISLVQKDGRMVIAYSSLSHLALVFLGVVAMNDIGWNGAILQMVNHGIYMAALFLLFGVVEATYETRELTRFGGLAARAPVFFGALWLSALAALGLPGLNGFAGEFTVLLGVYRTNAVWAWIAVVASILASAYFIRFFQKTAHGEASTLPGAPRLRRGQFAAVLPLLLLMLFLGLRPGIVPDRSEPTVTHYVAHAVTVGEVTRP